MGARVVGQARQGRYRVGLAAADLVVVDGLAGNVFVSGPSQPTAVDFMIAGPGLLTQVDLEARRWRTKRVFTPDPALLGGLGRALPPAELAGLTAGGRPSLTNVSPYFFVDRLLLTDIYLVAKRDLTTARRGRGVPVSHARVPRESFHRFADYRRPRQRAPPHGPSPLLPIPPGV
ncbi:hypothetical protein FRAHR75_330049 [Frankia sp. Hr75.2]|nr:hypothetical protein FRAHR75_330049 [Frankia sp. Hr75.2]